MALRRAGSWQRGDAYGEKHSMEYRRMRGGNPAIQGDPSDLEDFLERHEVRAIVTKPWNIYSWIRTGQGDALPGLGFVRFYIDRDTVILTRE